MTGAKLYSLVHVCAAWWCNGQGVGLAIQNFEGSTPGRSTFRQQPECVEAKYYRLFISSLLVELRIVTKSPSSLQAVSKLLKLYVCVSNCNRHSNGTFL